MQLRRLLALCLAWFATDAARGQSFAPLTYEARRAVSAVTLDGRLDEPAWAAADQIDKFSVCQQGSPPAQPVVARMLWDDDYVYAGFELSDADLWAISGHDAYLWEGDVAELFFQPTPGAGPYYEFEVSPKAEALDLHWLERLTDFAGAKAYESRLEAVVQARGTVASAAPTDPLHDDLDQGWTLELRVPRAALAPFVTGEEWGFLASAADYPRPPGASTLQFTSLLPAPYGFHTYERWERLAFVDEPLTPGDADRNGRVDLADFGTLKAHFGQPGTLREGEFTRDRQIDLADFGVLKANFGRPGAAAPEPSGLALVVAGLAAVGVGATWRSEACRGRSVSFDVEVLP